MNQITFIKIVETLNWLPKSIAVNNTTSAAKAHVLFLNMARDKFGFGFVNELKELGFGSVVVFKDYLNSESFREALEKDNFNKKDSVKILSNGKETHNRRRGIKEISTTASPYEGSF